ncbi:hypothetical protein N7532_011945 [Penicillium argentinense]|uniref:Uncharacterized protein n=1 Tax=Penicillium argentinense TaxID=1131581 RepID=A0A9W9EJE5_9EURO|nr:uncharacterized protein N7532_011945 [Penicillium argentinense]KAJ5082902.1 hypothetical protein N7532_011945 [Penicillium argentinense]
MALKSAIRNLRNKPQFLFVCLPNILSFLCIVVGVAWLLLLPLDDNSRRTYISENALLPGQVHAYFTGSEQNIFRGYKQELQSLLNEGRETESQGDEVEVTPAASNKVHSILQAAGLKVATQKYEYTSSGVTHQGENIYGIIHAPRGDATEAIVLVAAWKTADDELNLKGVTLALTLARYFKRWSLWSKDIIFLFTPDSKTGTQAWIDAYHDLHPESVQPLPLKSGALQGAVVIEFPFDHNFQKLHIVYDGVNGQLPNLDLFNTAVAIAGGQMGIGANLQEMWEHDDSYEARLQTMMRGMTKQGLGYATGAHSSFMPYHIDAITLQPKGEGWEDEMALGRTIESICRSLNNLLEHLHQSFFFYLLMHSNRFVSIGTYLPSAMLIAGNFTIMAIALWMRTGYYSDSKATAPVDSDSKNTKQPKSGSQDDENKAKINGAALAERLMALPLTLVTGLHLLGLVPLWIFNNIFHQYFTMATYVFVGVDIVLPLFLAALLSNGLGVAKPIVPQQYHLIKSFALLLLGLSLSTLATLNFSLSFMIGLLCAPLSFVGRLEGAAPLRYGVSSLGFVLLNLLSPPIVVLGVCQYTGVSVESVLTQAAFGWNVWDILASALDPVTKLIHTSIPVLQSVPHAINLLHIQHLGLNPVDLRNARNLINRTLQQAQRQSLHNQVLDLIGLHLSLRGNGIEGKGTVVRRSPEDHLGQRRQGDFLVEEDTHIVSGQITAVKGEEQLSQPVVRCRGERIQNGVQEELAKVVDGVGDQRSDTEVVGAREALVFGEVFEVDAGQVQEGVFVERGKFLFSLE